MTIGKFQEQHNIGDSVLVRTNYHGDSLPSPQPAVIVRAATFEEYIKSGVVFDARGRSRQYMESNFYFYEFSTD